MQQVVATPTDQAVERPTSAEQPVIARPAEESLDPAGAEDDPVGARPAVGAVGPARTRDRVGAPAPADHVAVRAAADPVVAAAAPEQVVAAGPDDRRAQSQAAPCRARRPGHQERAGQHEQDEDGRRPATSSHRCFRCPSHAIGITVSGHPDREPDRSTAREET